MLNAQQNNLFFLEGNAKKKCLYYYLF